VLWKSDLTESQSSFTLVNCNAIQENEYRETKMNPPMPSSPLFIESLSRKLESFHVLRCIIRIFAHDHTHHYQNCYHYQHTTSTDVATPGTSSLLFYLILSPPWIISMPSTHLALSPLLCVSYSFRIGSYCTIPITCYLNCDRVSLLGSRCSENTLLWFWLQWMSSMNLVYCL
jgi:hypothetical protein